jgi:putative cardiolipin synthase
VVAKSRWQRVRRVLKWFALGLVGLISLAYLFLAAALKWGEIRAGKQQDLDASIYTRSQEAHQLTLVDDGPTSLAKRLQLIDQARESLELEFFIYDVDLASRILTQRLIQKAHEGVRVRLLIDFATAPSELGPAYAAALRAEGIEVRYYNVVQPYLLLSVQHRSHRKLLVADGKVAITGGRNMGDEYFHISESFNFIDSDVVIEGPIVQSLRQSFEMYWSSPFAAEPKPLAFPGTKEARARDFVTYNERDRRIADFITEHSPELLARLVSHPCSDLTFVTDFPGVQQLHRRVFQVLSQVFLEAKQRIIGESPYVIIGPGGVEILKQLAARGVETTILTNSLRSTDAFYTVSALFATLPTLAHTQLSLHSYDGTAAAALLDIPLPVTNRWGLHAKRAVLDDDTVVIGTYNIDPRSANLNSEMILVCRSSPALAQQMLQSIQARLAHSNPVLTHGDLQRGALWKDSTVWDKTKMMLALPLSSMFNFLL